MKPERPMRRAAIISATDLRVDDGNNGGDGREWKDLGEYGMTFSFLLFIYLSYFSNTAQRTPHQ
uniref:Hexosyltransferase n=1 Tax=Rhizophora mucronata TaxID=61149 RepID=A0A2P2KAX4_RHIMU